MGKWAETFFNLAKECHKWQSCARAAAFCYHKTNLVFVRPRWPRRCDFLFRTTPLSRLFLLSYFFLVSATWTTCEQCPVASAGWMTKLKNKTVHKVYSCGRSRLMQTYWVQNAGGTPDKWHATRCWSSYILGFLDGRWSRLRFAGHNPDQVHAPIGTTWISNWFSEQLRISSRLPASSNQDGWLSMNI